VVGSEGTLGIVTGILVKLTENPPAVRTLLVTFDSIEAAAGAVSAVIAAGVVPAALEMMDQPMVAAVEAFIQAGLPVDAAAVLIAEVVGLEAGVTAEAALVEQTAREQGATSVRVAADDDERALLWRARKSAFGAVAQAAPDYYLHDTVVPRTALADVITKVYEIGKRYDVQMLNVFHAGDGNLHPLVAFDGAESGKREKVMAAAEEMVRVSVEAGGSLTGEHGIGIEKRDLMGLVFSAVDLDAQARLREAFDPSGMLNPGKILPLGSRCYDYGMTSLPEGREG
jgi:glycolate oxidase